MKRTVFTTFQLLVTFSLCFLILSQDSDEEKLHETTIEKANIINLGKKINSAYVEYTPFITSDENFLYFQSNRPGIGKKGSIDIWYCINENPGSENPEFSVPKNVGVPLNSKGFDGLPSLRERKDGSYEIYFTSFASKNRLGPKKTNIYYSYQSNGKWVTPTLVQGINTDYHDRMPSISADGKFLYFSSNRPGGFGKDDIWVTEFNFRTKRFKKPENLGSGINSAASEGTPSIHPDGITFFLSSDRDGGVGGFDIYMTKLLKKSKDRGREKLENLGTPYNTFEDEEYPTVTKNGKRIYFASTRDGGFGTYDIYRANVPDFAKPKSIITLKGKVKDNDSKEGLFADIKIVSGENERFIKSSLPGGDYAFDLFSGEKYTILVKADGYYEELYKLDLINEKNSFTKEKDFLLLPKMKIPEVLRVKLQFKNDRAELLNPKVNYSFGHESTLKDLPSIKKEYLIEEKVKLNKQPEINSEDAISQLNLDIKAEMKGYYLFNYSLNILEILRLQKSRYTDFILLSFLLKDKDLKRQLISTIYFDTNRFKRIRKKSRKNLKKVYNIWKKKEGIRIVLIGHTDHISSHKYNMSLSKWRAKYIKKKLVKQGIPAKKIEIEWFGFTKPAATGKNSAAKAQNRRVLIYLLSF